MSLLTLKKRFDAIAGARRSGRNAFSAYLGEGQYRVFNSEHQAQPESAGLDAARRSWGIDKEDVVLVWQVIRTAAGMESDAPGGRSNVSGH